MKTNLLIILSLLLLAATTSQAQPYLAALSKPSCDIENGKLVIRSLFGTLKTNLKAQWDDIKLKNYIITDKAFEKYNNKKYYETH